jgi:DNA repair protein RecO (recombination protein O)
VAFHTQALLLRAVDFGESDRIVHLLTPRRGRVTAMAKGARRSTRRFPGTLDFFNHLQVQLDPSRRAGALARLEHARLLRSFLGLRIHPARFGLASYVLELLDRLAPEGGARPDMERLFAFALEALASLDGALPDQRLRTLLELRALDALGVCPELSRCVRCRQPLCGVEAIEFHVADGGPHCRACAGGPLGAIPVHRGTLRTLERALRFDLGRLERLALSGIALQEARRLIARFQRFHVGVELRSERFLDAILASAPSPAA